MAANRSQGKRLNLLGVNLLLCEQGCYSNEINKENFTCFIAAIERILRKSSVIICPILFFLFPAHNMFWSKKLVTKRNNADVDGLRQRLVRVRLENYDNNYDELRNSRAKFYNNLHSVIMSINFLFKSNFFTLLL